MTENKDNLEVSTTSNAELLEHTSQIVSAYVSYNSVSSEELPNLVVSVHEMLVKAAETDTGELLNNLKPAVPIKQSVTDDYIICLEDGKKFKSLKRHLRTYYDLSPVDYREKWGLAADYPMVAPNYAIKRSKLAREYGLGRKPGTKIKKRK